MQGYYRHQQTLHTEYEMGEVAFTVDEMLARLHAQCVVPMAEIANRLQNCEMPKLRSFVATWIAPKTAEHVAEGGES
jgi:hypothetical protein